MVATSQGKWTWRARPPQAGHREAPWRFARKAERCGQRGESVSAVGSYKCMQLEIFPYMRARQGMKSRNTDFLKCRSKMREIFSPGQDGPTCTPHRFHLYRASPELVRCIASACTPHRFHGSDAKNDVQRADLLQIDEPHSICRLSNRDRRAS